MSDSTEILEITDMSIKINNTESLIEDNNKRKLSKDDVLEETISGKKICRDTENFEDSSLIVEPTLTESLVENTNNESMLEENITESKLVNDLAENITLDDEEPSRETLDDKLDERAAPDEIIEEASNFDAGISSSDDDDDEEEEDYDDSLIISAMNSLPKYSSSNAPKISDDQEPIALDSDTEEESDGEENESIEEINDEDEDNNNPDQDEQSSTKIYNETSLKKRLIMYNPKFYLARRLLKKSLKVLLTQRTNSKAEMEQDFKKEQEDSVKSKPTEEVTLETQKYSNEKPEQQDSKIDDGIEKKCNTENKILENCEKEIEEKPLEQASINVVEKNNHEMNEKSTEDINSLPKEVEDFQNDKDENTKVEESNINEIGSLLNEISCCTIDDIMTRYIFCNSDNSSALSIDEFSEQLFYCLQENKKDIENLQRLWNEKVHLKFKMREIMERIRRHRVISEIETFGVKPIHDSQPNNLLSSKSSTTNSENEHYVKSSSKISSQSVNRLIQDVRENVLKKEKKRMDEYASNASAKYDESFDDCNSFALAANMFQSSSNQGRQGQIIDVQSIINDFRQKNPQEIPRRGRRMKSSFPNSFLMSNQLQSQQNIIKDDDKINNATLDHNNSTKSSVGFPEVSLLPVNNFYKNHSPQYGQKSSLLQSILTKQPNKNPLVAQPNSKSSTLARLLTAPEKNPSRSILQQSSKVHNNGEITITPIAGTSRRQMIDDEENSEPPLVIDESDDFDMSDRHNASGTDLLCQGCRRNKALFMCAGCSRQWYCSKECQELAWDDHAESCMV